MRGMYVNMCGHESSQSSVADGLSPGSSNRSSTLCFCSNGAGDADSGDDIWDATGEGGADGTGMSSGACELMWDWIRELWQMR
jgi:hypothetical protein